MKLSLCCAAVLALLTACTRENSDQPKAETTVHIDTGETKDALQKNLDKAGQEIKKGANEAKDKLQEAGDTLKDKFESAKRKLEDDKHAEVKVEVKK